MQINYTELNKTITPLQESTYAYEILRNPYIPKGSKKYPNHKVEPYFEQMMILLDECEQKYPDYKLISGGAFSGKSQMIAIMAARYLMYPNYRSIILRNTYKQVVSSGGAVDKLRNWLLDKRRLGKYACRENKTEMYFEAPNGARIYYGYCDREDQMDKIRGTSYHIIFVEEASEIPGDILEFLPRSIRPWNGFDYIPETYILNSNPSFGPGVDWLRKNFIDPESPHKHYQLNLMMNPYVDRLAYDKRLSEMSPVQQAFMRFGDWDYVPNEGLLLTREQLSNSECNINTYNYKDTVFSIVGIDVAGEGRDYTSMTLELLQKDGRVILDDNIHVNESTFEDNLIEFILTCKQKVNLNRIIFEGEPGSYGKDALKHYKRVLRKIQDQYPFTVKLKPVHKNKYERARPLAYGIRQGYVQIRNNIPNKHLLQNQFMYVHPDKKIMKKHKSPDYLDSCTLAYNEINKLFSVEEYYNRNNKAEA
ncbi:phage terminase large subunit [Methanosphaera sp.]|uniref:phage terminase large subunit n=1 Tax=Methanosphaera sp. TaxID=2666342 RepID=UPI0025EE28E4|nr:phage terminase large subunit [Methanosphaera sp.]